jgi:hypothetical protein
MTDVGLGLQTALERYNHLFDNSRYNAHAATFAAELRVDRDSQRVSDALNLLLCGIWAEVKIRVDHHPTFVQVFPSVTISRSQLSAPSVRCQGMSASAA